jgi:ABC-type Fe3+-hydroxamate transport system substrate-binding protein
MEQQEIPMTAAPADTVDAVGIRHQPVSGPARIISVVPSITELLFDMGLGEQVVGRTGFCFHPKAKVRKVAKVGGTKDFDLEKIRALEPTHLIVNVDENPRERVEAAGQFVTDVIVTHPMSPLDNIALYRLLGAIFGRDREAEALAKRFEAAYQEAVEATHSLPRERVLYVIWKSPWMTISRDTYIARTLAARGSRSQGRWRRYTSGFPHRCRNDLLVRQPRDCRNAVSRPVATRRSGATLSQSPRRAVTAV